MTIAENLINQGIDKGREEMKAGIHELLSGFCDYSQYKDEVTSRLCEVKDLSKMKELFLAAARTNSTK